MTTQQTPSPQSDWTRTKIYAVIIAVTAIVAAGAAFYQAWKTAPPALPPPQGPVVQNPPGPTPSPLPNPPITQQAKSQNVCGKWLSTTSGKRYDFVCQGEDIFEIYEVGEAGPTKTGTGKVNENGTVEADLLSLAKNRKAQLKLRFSDDGRKLEGAWRGEDPRESGRLTFSKV